MIKLCLKNGLISSGWLELKDLILGITALLRLPASRVRRFRRLVDRTALLVFLTLALLNTISVLLLPPGFDHTLNSLHLGNLRDASILNRVGRDRLSSPTGVYVNVLVPIPTINVLLYLNELGVNRFLRLVHLTINCTVNLILVTDCILDLIFVHLPGRIHTD